jgi:predicted RecB family nuclease
MLTAADISHCVHRVALDRGIPETVPGEPLSTEVIRRIREATEHRLAIADELARLHPDAATAASPGATLAAMSSGVAMIFSARLVDDFGGRRSSSVDALVRVDLDGERPRYAPLIIKLNEVTEQAATRRLLQGDLATVHPDKASWVGGVGPRRNDTMTRNGLALAHATRALETLGHEDLFHRGGIVDRHGQLWWFDLDSAEWPRWRLSAYDAAYEERVAVLDDHDAFVRGEGPFPTVPYWHRECPTCPYAARCESELERVDDVSLVRFTSLEQQVLLREHGVTTRAELALLDPERARLGRSKSLSTAAELGLEEHLGRTIDKLDELIYRARVVVRRSPLRIVDASQVSCPTADVEVDVDMESYDERTYLWGALVTTRREIEGVETGYRAFVNFETLDDESESILFGEFWRWFCDLRERVERAGATFAAYCFWAHAEDGAMNRAVLTGAQGTPSREDLDAFRGCEPPQWIDLHSVAKGLVQTDGPLGLKSLAGAAGFTWRDAHPSGEASMTWYEEAVGNDPDASRAARRRLLEYNEDDCRATAALRAWINSTARTLPSRDERP